MFYYRVCFYDGIEHTTKTESGLVAAADYGNAANKIVAFYGKGNLNVLGLYEVEDILTQDEIADMMYKELDL